MVCVPTMATATIRVHTSHAICYWYFFPLLKETNWIEDARVSLYKAANTQPNILKKAHETSEIEKP